MSGFETIIRFGYLSDEQRWNANRYDFPWLSELDEHDRGMIMLLDCLRDGEFSGFASGVQFHELVLREKEAGCPPELINDWSPFLAYMNIIVYEEMRHGITLGVLHHYVTKGNTNFIGEINTREFSDKYVYCYEGRRYWDLYSYALSHLFAEVINTELYRDLTAQIHHPNLKTLLGNVRNDEARHIVALGALIGDLIKADPVHKERALASLERSLTYHNAMVHETYFEGLNKMMPIFLPPRPNKPGAIQRISKHKLTVLDNIFGDDNPYTEKDIVNLHMQYLCMAAGHKRAQYAESAPGNIAFG